MTPEQLIRQLPPRPGYRVADYVHVGMPIYRITARLFTQVQKKIGAIDEFLLRLIRIGVQHTPEISEFLGLERSFVDDSFSQLLMDDLLTLHSGTDRRQRLSLTEKGVRCLEAAETLLPEEKTFVVEYDALLRKIVLVRREQLYSGFQIRKMGYKQIRPLLKRPLDSGDLDIADLQKAIRAGSSQRDAQRFVLAVNELYRKRLYFLPAIAVVYRSVDAADIQVSFVVDGKPSPDHDEAFAKLDGVRQLGIESDLERNQMDVAVVNEVLKEAESLLPASDTKLKSLPDTITQESEPSPYRHLSAEQNNDLEKNGVALLSVQDHRPLLDHTLRFAKHRLAIVCPFLHESVVSESFERQLEMLLRKGVRVTIGYGMPDQATRAPSKSHLNVIQKLESIGRRFRQLRIGKIDSHAKLLLMDTTYFVIGSFNWLSFQGDPDRPFRDEQSVLVSIPNMIERKFHELNESFPP